ncbi:hypothetical protein K788_00006685 (plasmid) [Paraburkholderia caribensis MBA4]|uniref:Uncharacterized protein n=1 Tax=Paraburkholderia caribensis MBA4 TaxID=1323664 RepID=A0A0P0RN55_9BURK|nr:hypothetical protein K788_00006685 [Paraburkholderia caribensis MBA4]
MQDECDPRGTRCTRPTMRQPARNRYPFAMLVVTRPFTHANHPSRMRQRRANADVKRLAAAF